GSRPSRDGPRRSAPGRGWAGERRGRRAAAALCALILLVTAGCGGGPRRAARTADGANSQTAGLAPSAAPAADSGTTGATGQGGLPAPLPPDVGGAGLPPVVSRVATSDPVVFVTIDDGWTKDPPVLPFLADFY